MEQCYLLKVKGHNCIVFDSKGKEITRRENMGEKEYFIKFPYVKSFMKFTTVGATVLSKNIVENTFPEIELPPREKPYTGQCINSVRYIPAWHSPASINTKRGILIYNEYFSSLPFVKKVFIKEHECGHFAYNTEKYCDLYATKKIIELGFGLSQCLEILRNTLKDSPEKTERYNYVTKILRNGQRNL